MGDGDGRWITRAGWACPWLAGRWKGGPPGSGSGKWGSGPSAQQSTGLVRNLAGAGDLGVALGWAGHNSATLNLSLPAIR